MEATSAAVGLFQACLHSYRVITQAMELGAEAVVWDVLMRIELTRFEVWGRMLGFLDEKTGKERPPNEAGQILDLAEILQIEAARDLVKDILASLKKSLDEFKEAAAKYHLNPRPTKRAPPGISSKRLQRFEVHVNQAWKSSKDLSMRLLLIVKDKEKIKDLLKNLTAFNNGLEKLLSVPQRGLSARALSSSVLGNYDDSTHLDILTLPSFIPGQTEGIHRPQNHRVLAATAQVKQLCRRPAQNRDETTLGKYKLDASSFDIPIVPRNPEAQILWPISVGQYRSEQTSSTPVLVEWRLPDPLAVASRIGSDELVLRRSMVVELLHETSKLNVTDYRVLDCFGWFLSSARTSEGGMRDIVGFASKLPTWADAGRKPISLHTLLTTSFEDEDPGSIPSLRARFQLAKNIAQTVYQLLCSRWLHRTLSSHQIIFFYDEETTELRMDLPYVIGLQYSRPDDQEDQESSRGGQPLSEGQLRDWGSLAIYLEPQLLGRRTRRYRRSDDVYSLGIILFEIAFWEPAEAYVVGSAIMKTARTELGAEVGPIYQRVVLSCLEGLQKSGPSEATGEDLTGYDGSYQGEDPEYGLESDVFWRVVRQLANCHV
ncbi:Fc.00g068650.m01.CDS01 [Cosmosporella sp. VM-42]